MLKCGLEWSEAPLEHSPNLTDCIIETLNVEWRRISKMFKSMVLFRKISHSKNSKKIRFGHEIIYVNTHIYRSFIFNHLLTISLFGYNFSSLLEHEIVYESNDVNVVHIFSHRRVKEVFTFGGLDASTYYAKGKKIICCGKVNVKMNDLKEIGYIINETEAKIEVKLQSRPSTVFFDLPRWNKSSATYEYMNSNTAAYQLTQVWPIKIKISSKWRSTIIIHSYSSENNNNPI